jgi:hypothetical protein
MPVLAVAARLADESPAILLEFLLDGPDLHLRESTTGGGRSKADAHPRVSPQLTVTAGSQGGLEIRREQVFSYPWKSVDCGSTSGGSDITGENADIVGDLPAIESDRGGKFCP